MARRTLRLAVQDEHVEAIKLVRDMLDYKKGYELIATSIKQTSDDCSKFTVYLQRVGE
jgi:hypothetical protein